MTDAFVPDEVGIDRPYTGTLVAQTLDCILRGHLSPGELAELGRAIEQAKRGATGSLPGR
jgi:hypothetical protein